MNNEIRVLGKTTPKEIFLISQNKPFIQNEYMVIEDSRHDGNIIGEIIETVDYPMIINEILPQGSFIEFIEKMGYEIHKSVSIAKVKIINDLQYPVTPSSVARKPYYEEVKDLLINSNLPNEGLLLGIIKGTEDVHKSLPNDLKDIVPLWVNKKIVPQNGVPFSIDYNTFREYPGIGLFGGSGSGKTVALRSLCEEIMNVRIPGIVGDPHFEVDFDENNDGISELQMRDYSDRYKIFQVGENIGINFSKLSAYELIDLLEFSQELSEPMKSALVSIYEKGDTLAYLLDKIQKIRTVFENDNKPSKNKEPISQEQFNLYIKHKNDIAGATTLQGLSWRLTGLQKTGIFNNDISQLEKAIKECKLSIIRSTSYKTLKIMMSYVIKKMYKKRRKYAEWEQQLNRKANEKPNYFPMFLIIADEVHNFAPNTSNTTPLKSILREIAQEGRKYGVTGIFATQRPSLLDTTIVAQLNTKFIFRTNIKQDMDTIRVETNLSDENFIRLPDLSSGDCFVSSATLRKTYFVKFRTTRTKSPHQSNPFDELEEYKKQLESNSLDNVLEKMLPIKLDKIMSLHPDINRVYGEVVSIEEIIKTLDTLANRGKIEKQKTPMGDIYKSI